MSYVLPLTAEEVKRRLLKVADLAVHPAIYVESEAAIKVVLEHFIEDGSEIKFKAPINCSAVTKLLVQYVTEDDTVVSKVFAFADANGNDVGEVNNLFDKDSIVKVVLDLDTSIEGVDGAAFVQNADTNAYLENRFSEIISEVNETTSNIQLEALTYTDEQVSNATTAFNEAIADLSDTIVNDIQATTAELVTGKADTIQNASGSLITINNSANAPLGGLKIYGKTTQDGIPTPDAPIDLVGAGDNGTINITIKGKNLLNEDQLIGKNLTKDEESGIFTLTTNSSNVFFNPPIPANTPFTISIENLDFYNGDYSTAISASLGVVGGTQTVNFGGASGDAITRTFDAPLSWMKFYRYKFNEAIEGAYVSFTGIQVEIGDKFTGFEPYKEPQALTVSTPNGLHGVPVSIGGNYTDSNGQQWVCDEIDYANGVYVQRVKSVVLDDSLDYGWLSVGSYSNGNKFASMVFTDMAQNSTILCSCYEVTGWSNVHGHAYGSGTALVMADNRFTDRATAIATITEIKPKFLYILANPVEKKLSAEELADYALLHTNKPNTTILNDAGASMDVSYFTPSTAVQMMQSPVNEGKVLTIDEHGCVVPGDVNAFYTDELETDASTVPLNADTLGGFRASDFAKISDIPTVPEIPKIPVIQIIRLEEND